MTYYKTKYTLFEVVVLVDVDNVYLHHAVSFLARGGGIGGAAIVLHLVATAWKRHQLAIG